MTNQQYIKFTDERANRSKTFINCIKAFFCGGFICLLGELLSQLYQKLGANSTTSLLLASISLIFLSALLTAIGVFDKIAKFGGGGALVPITGFANSIVSPAIEAKSEGYVTGVASKIFTIAGPVILYGVFSSVIFGIIYFFVTL